jgi:lipoate-protein ligase B
MVEWRVTPGLTDYEEAVRVMEQRAEDIAAGRADELLWFVEHGKPKWITQRSRTATRTIVVITFIGWAAQVVM